MHCHAKERGKSTRFPHARRGKTQREKQEVSKSRRKMVGAARFELATSCTPSKRASRATLRPDRNRNQAREDTIGSKLRINHEDSSPSSHPLLRNRVRRVAVKRLGAFHQRLAQG